MRLYPILAPILGPLALLALRWLGRREPEWLSGLEQRRGELPTFPTPPLWVHAASVGEVRSAWGLLRALRDQYPQRPFLLTAFTPTGVAAWHAAQIANATVAAWPFDHGPWVRRALRRVQPQLLLIIETEIWPQMLLAAHQQQVPVVFASARVRARSVRGWQRWLGPGLLRRCLAPVALLGTQTAADAQRFEQLGAGRVEALGSLKWDLCPASPDPDWAECLVAACASRSVWLAASTHPGEEEAVLAAHRALRERWPQALLILAPRHPRRAAQVMKLAEREDLPTVRRSAGVATDDAAVWLLDTLGELQGVFEQVKVVFMGGSLVPVGGHNLLEPARASCAIISGPHWRNAEDVGMALQQAQAWRLIEHGSELVDVVGQLWQCAATTQMLGQAAHTVQQAGSGAQARIQAALTPWLRTERPVPAPAVTRGQESKGG